MNSSINILESHPDWAISRTWTRRLCYNSRSGSLRFLCSLHTLQGEAEETSFPALQIPLEIWCCINPQQTAINLANVHCVCEDGVIFPRQALENNVLISDGNLLFFAINCAYTVPLNYGPSSFIPGLWNVKSDSQKALKRSPPKYMEFRCFFFTHKISTHRVFCFLFFVESH